MQAFVESVVSYGLDVVMRLSGSKARSDAAKGNRLLGGTRSGRWVCGLRAYPRDAVEPPRVLEPREEEGCNVVDTWTTDPKYCRSYADQLDWGPSQLMATPRVPSRGSAQL